MSTVLPGQLWHSDTQSSDGRFSSASWCALILLPNPPTTKWVKDDLITTGKKTKQKKQQKKTNPVDCNLLTFHPVALKVFPALPMVTVRSHIPGRLAGKRKSSANLKVHKIVIWVSCRVLLLPIFICFVPSYVSHSYTSSLMQMTSCLMHKSAITWSSSRW